MAPVGGNQSDKERQVTRRLIVFAKSGAAFTQRLARFAHSEAAHLTQRVARLARSTARLGKEALVFVQTSPAPRSFLLGYLIFAAFTSLIVIALLLLAQTQLESYSLGYQISKITQQKQEAAERLRVLETHRTRLMASGYLLQMNETFRLDLLPPDEWWEK